MKPLDENKQNEQFIFFKQIKNSTHHESIPTFASSLYIFQISAGHTGGHANIIAI